MNNEEKILAILASMQTELASMQTEQRKTNERLESIEERLDRVEGIVTRIETDHGTSIKAIADGVLQNAQRLDRIDEKVSVQDDFILKRVFPKALES